MDNGEPFPFIASTQLYPEWNLGSLQHVNSDVTRQVQVAMLSLQEQAQMGDAIYNKFCANVGDDGVGGSAPFCNDPTHDDDATLRPYVEVVNSDKDFDFSFCDSSSFGIANIARQAMVNGRYAGFRTTQSYIEIRSMLQDTDFIRKNETDNTWSCAR